MFRSIRCFRESGTVIKFTVTGTRCLPSDRRPELKRTYTLRQNYNYLYIDFDYICYDIVSWHNVLYFMFTTNNSDIIEARKTELLLHGPTMWQTEILFPPPTDQFSYNSAITQRLSKWTQAVLLIINVHCLLWARNWIFVYSGDIC
jgi:hypothetical protein